MKYQLRTFKDILDAVVETLKIQKTDAESIRRTKRQINEVYLNEIMGYKQWEWLRTTRTLQTEPFFSAGNAAVTQNEVLVTLTQSPATSRAGYYFLAGNESEIYRIKSHVAGSNILLLETPFNGATNLLNTYKIWAEGIPLPSDCKEVLSVTHSYINRPLQQMGINEFRRQMSAYGTSLGRPMSYSVGPAREPDTYENITSLPMSVSRSSNGLTKTINIGASPSNFIAVGDYISVSGASDYSYNVESVVSAINGNTFSYTGTVALNEATINDSSIIIRSLREGNEASYRNLILYPAICDKRTSMVVDYQINPEALEFDGDEPLMPVNDRMVLYYGAMWLAASRERNESWAQENLALMKQMLARMAGKNEATAERPVMRVSQNYMSSKRRSGVGRRAGIGYGIDGGISGFNSGVGGASLVTGTPNTIAVFNEQGELVGSDEVTPGSFPGTTISYNNAGTTISATTLQGAITELDGDNQTQNSAITAAQSTGSSAYSAAVAAQATANTGVANALTAQNRADSAYNLANTAYADISAHETATSGVHGVTGNVVGTTDSQTLSNKTLSSPALTGVPTAPTAANGTNTTQIATTAFVLANGAGLVLAPNKAVVSNGAGSAVASTTTDVEIGYVSGVTSAIQPQIDAKAPLASPALTGTPTVPTASPGTNTTQAASTAFVTAAVAAIPPPVTTASGVSNVPAGNISATNVQSAINELDSEKADAAATTSALALKAPLASPALTGTPTAPTAAPLTNTTQLATTAFVTAAVAAAPGGVTSVFTRTGAVTAQSGDYTATQVTNTPAGGISATNVQTALNQLDTLKAPLASPALTGTPTAPTAAALTSTTQLATTAFVTTANALKADLASPALTGTPTAPTAALGTSTTQLATTAFVANAMVNQTLNWISPSDGANLTGYNVYNDGATATPIDGTGGTATVTFTASTTAPLQGASSYLFTKPASNVQGQGFSKDFTIDSGYVNSPVPETIRMLLNVSSGTYASGDLAIWIYDVTNAVLIQPSAYLVQNAIGTQQIKCEFQPNSNSSSYRLIGHVASTSALAYTLKIDTISVSPNTVNFGANVSDPVAFSPTVSSTGTAPVFGGTAVRVGSYRRVGTNGEFDLRVGNGSGSSGTAGTGVYLFNLPAGLSIDTTVAKIPTTLSTSKGTATADGSVLGVAANGVSGNGMGTVVAASSTQVAVFVGAMSTATATNFDQLYYWGQGGNNNLDASSASEVYYLKFSVPIVGWGSSQVLSSDTDTRVVAASVSGGTGTISTTQGGNFPNTDKDTHGAISTVSSATRFTAPVAGTYVFTGTVFPGTAISPTLVKNGTTVLQYFASAGLVATGVNLVGGISSVPFDLKAGEYIELRANTSSTLGTGGALFNTWGIERLSGPAQIAASEKVFLKYTGNAGTAFTSTVTDIPFITKGVDSHGAWSGSLFTAPRAGWFDIKGSILAGSLSAQPQLYINGVLDTFLEADYASDRKHFNGGAFLLAGQTMSIRYNASGTLSNSPTQHWIAITSQG